MDSPAREKEEMDEYVLVPDAADELDEDAVDCEDADDVYEHEARLLVGNNETTIENYFASEPTLKATAQCGTVEAAAPSGAESEGSVDDDVKALDGGLSDEVSGTEEVGVAEESECKQGEGDHGCQQHAVGVICSLGLAAAATGMASSAAAQCGTAEAVAPSGAESEGSVDEEVEAVDGGLSYEGPAAEEVGVAEEPECKDGEGDHGTTWQQHAAGVIRSLGFAAVTGLAVLLISQQQTPHRVHFRLAGDRKAAKVSARREARRGSVYKF
ncbi:unnamed protein product [Alopecurus aequalis]